MAASASADNDVVGADSSALVDERRLVRPNLGRRLTRKASAPCLRDAFVIVARKKHCQKCDDSFSLLTSFEGSSMALRSLSRAENMRSKSSLVSSSRPGRSDRIVALSAGRRAEASSFSMWFSKMARNSGRTESDANEGTEARPGK